MREGAILASFIYFEIPDDCSKEYYRRLHKEIALLLHPRLIEVEHYRVGTLVGIRDVLHKVGVYGVATVASPWVVKIDYIEFRFDFIPVQMVNQMVVGNGGQVCKLEIVDIHRVTLLNLLLDIGIYHCIGLSAARSSENDGSPERIDDVYPTVIPPLLIIETGGQIDRILVLDEPCLLHEALVLVVEHVVHQVCLQQPAHPRPRHQQAYIACGNGSRVEYGIGDKR